MNYKEMIVALVSSAVALVGAFDITCQLYKMTKIDAAARGLKHPKLWGLLAMNGNNSSGLLLYLIGRKNYPVLSMSEQDHTEMESRKKKAGVGLIFLAAGAIGLILSITLL